MVDIAGHGTAVAGIIGAEYNNGEGVFGVCQNVQIVSLKVAHNKGDDITAESITAAVKYAAENGIDILHYSGSGEEYSMQLKNEIMNFPGLFVCTAGNKSPEGVCIDVISNIVYPASFKLDNMIVVAASTPIDQQKRNSNFGAETVNIFAPGVDILTTYPIAMCQAGAYEDCDHTVGGIYSAGYHRFQNTSAAAPFVTGVAALVLAQHPNYSASQIKGIILNNVDLVPGLQSLCTTGGRLNAYNAVSYTHSYTHEYVSNGSSSHRAYCECEEYITQAHSYTYSYSSLNENQHKASCRCGAYITVNHSYTNRYVSANASMHKAYCICDAYKFENHSMSNPNSSGLATCSKCGHGIQMWNITPKYELE